MILFFPQKRGRLLLLPLALLLFALGLFTGWACLLPADAAQPSMLPTQAAHAAPLTPTAAATVPPTQGEVLLVNAHNPIAAQHTISPVLLRNDQVVDARCYPDLQRMMDACRAAGLQPLICSSYRTHAQQQALYDDKVARLCAQGYDAAAAAERAAREVALPGTSEHHTGLAVDIVDFNYQHLDDRQEQTPVQQWLLQHCWEYGFILRYPPDKSHITGIIYEPWHYRWVGVEAAQEMHQNNLTLEEYLGRE